MKPHDPALIIAAPFQNHAIPSSSVQKRNRLTKLEVRKSCQPADDFWARTAGPPGRLTSG